MSREERRYIRVYLDFPDRFPDIYYSDSALGTYLLLLAEADATWPFVALLPAIAKRRDVRALVDAGVINLVDNYGYRVPELDAQREQRRAKGSAAGSSRWSRPRQEGGRPASLKTRFAVLSRDGYRCHYCGRTADQVALDVDHVIPVREGGTNDPANLVAACADCNSGKSGHGLGDFE